MLNSAQSATKTLPQIDRAVVGAGKALSFEAYDRRSRIAVGERGVLHLLSLPRLALDCRELCAQLNVSQELDPLSVRVSLKKPFMGGVGAGIVYDLAQAKFGRRTAQLIGARSTAAIWVTDYLIDDFGIEAHRKIEVLDRLFESLTSGRVYSFTGLPQLDAVSLQFSRLWHSLECAPFRKSFDDAFSDLKDVAKRQICGDCSLELATELGAKSLVLISQIPAAWDPAAQRIAPALAHMGGFLQLFDDLLDIEHDRNCSIRTFATEAGSHAEAVSFAIPKARELLHAAYGALPQADHWALDAIYFAALYSTKQLRAHRDVIPRRPRS